MKHIKRHSRIVSLLALLVVVAIGSSLFAASVMPSRGSSASSWAEFVVASPLSQNYIIDKPRLWLPVSGGSQLAIASLVGLGGGTPALAELNSSETAGFLLNANDESVAWLFPLPPDIDTDKDIELNVLHTNSASAGTGTIKYTCVYDLLTSGTTAVAVANDAFDTVGTAAADLGANILQWSPTQVIDGGTIAGVAGDDLFVLSCKVTLVTVVDSTILGARLTYHRKFLGGGGSY